MAYSNTPYHPVDISLLQRELFSGPWRTGTMSEYFEEVSRGMFVVSGRVYGWTELSGEESYYSGGVGSWGLNLVKSRTGEMIAEAIQQADPEIDFGMYDNDGPDQVPNSGDDDGYVDIIFLITPTMGAECDFFSSHFWSHSGSYAALWSEDGQPVITSDPAAGGGRIRVDDYIIAPSISCDPFGQTYSDQSEKSYLSSGADTLIEIGLFCHELAHALGLPDLYDTDVSKGIGYWGLMGFGELNTPESPAHLSAYSKEKLGWAEIINAGPGGRSIRLKPVIHSGQVVKLAVPQQRFRRVNCPVSGWGYALTCGLNPSEAEARGWPNGGGYGNMWEEMVGREFSKENNGSCDLAFEVSVDAGPGDFGCLLLEMGGMTDTLAIYSGSINRDDQVVGLPVWLNGFTGKFTLRFHFVSDYSGSDEDGGFDSEWCRTFRVDNLSLTGGGIDYYCDFEDDEGGWKYLSASNEYFLAEYRTREGFDRNLIREGLLIWHVDDPLARSILGNSGGSYNQQVRGVVLEEADGRFDILSGSMGEESDPFPGSTGSRSFDPSTSPGSRSNCGRVTPISIEGISRGVSFGSSYMGAVFRGGSPDSVISNVLPAILSYADCFPGRYFTGINWNITGSGPYRSLLYRSENGSEFALLDPDTMRSSSGSFSYRDYKLEPGVEYRYRLSVFNDSGEESVTLEGSYALAEKSLRFISCYPNPFRREVSLVFYLPETPVAEISLFDVRGSIIESTGRRSYSKGLNSIIYTPGMGELPSGVYLCLLESGGERDVIKLVVLK